MGMTGRLLILPWNRSGRWVNPPPMLLDKKKLLVTGVLTPQSIAFSIAEQAQKAGAEVLLTSFGRPMSLTQRTAKKLQPVPDVLELDVTNPAHFAALAEELKKRWGRVDGV